MFRLAAAVAFGSVAFLGAASAQAPVSFHRDVRPILEKRCSGCHQPAIRGGKLSVVTYAALKSGGVSGAGFVSGKPADSPCVVKNHAKVRRV